MHWEPVIGLEVHAELLTNSKMFCGCRVVDSTTAEPNTVVCPICAGMPGMLPVVNQRAVEFGLRVALALNCTINPHNVFARKNYFYPDLPKGYQISQYELPLAVNGFIVINTDTGPKTIRIRRVHLEEDTGKLYHREGSNASLVDLNRAGVPLLEIVSEPDLRSPEEARTYGMKLRTILRYLGVNTGDMEKGVIRFEANISVRPAGTDALNNRTEIKNLNSFRALLRASEQEINRQIGIYENGGTVLQQTLGWHEGRQEVFAQRSKENADDYRYFPEPDLPPLIIAEDWIEAIRTSLPELPDQIRARYIAAGLSEYDAGVLVAEQAITHYFDQALLAAQTATPPVAARDVANWLTGELFGIMNATGDSIETVRVTPAALVELVGLVQSNDINTTTAKKVLRDMADTGERPSVIVAAQGLRQVNDARQIAAILAQLIADNPKQIEQYLGGKETVSQWFFGQTMRALRGQANPQVVQHELNAALAEIKARQAS